MPTSPDGGSLADLNPPTNVRTDFVDKSGEHITPGIMFGRNRTAEEITHREKEIVGHQIGDKTGSTDTVANYYAGEKQLMDEVITRPAGQPEDGFGRLRPANVTPGTFFNNLNNPTTEAGPANPAPAPKTEPIPAPAPAATEPTINTIDEQTAFNQALAATPKEEPEVVAPAPAPQPETDPKLVVKPPVVETPPAPAKNEADTIDPTKRIAVVNNEADTIDPSKRIALIDGETKTDKDQPAEKKRGFWGRLKDKISNRVKAIRDAISNEIKNIKAEDLKRFQEKANKAESKAAAKLDAIDKDANDKAAAATTKLKAKIGNGPFDALIEGFSIVTPAILLAPAALEKGIAKVVEFGQKFRADLQEMDAQDKEMKLLKMNEGDKGETRLAQAATESRGKAIQLRDAAEANKAKIEKFRLINRAMNAMYRRVA